MSCVQSTDNTVAVSVTRGDTMRLAVDLADATGTAVDVTGWSWLSQLRTDPDDVALVPIEVAVLDAPGGRLTLELAPDLTGALPVRDFVFDVQATDAGGDVRTILTGQIRIREDVTR